MMSNHFVEEVLHHAIKLGGGLGVAGAVLGGALAWPRCEFATQAPSTGSLVTCHNAWGPVPAGEFPLDSILLSAAMFAALGALLALILVTLFPGLRDSLGMEE